MVLFGKGTITLNVARTIINDIKNGGFRMLDIQSMIHSQKVMVLKKYADKDHISSRKIILDFFLFQVGQEFILKCNFNTRKLPIYLPACYKECPDTMLFAKRVISVFVQRCCPSGHLK